MAIELLTPFTKVELEPEIKNKKRKQVGILGGNFNPVHNAHLVVEPIFPNLDNRFETVGLAIEESPLFRC